MRRWLLPLDGENRADALPVCAVVVSTPSPASPKLNHTAVPDSKSVLPTGGSELTGTSWPPVTVNCDPITRWPSAWLGSKLSMSLE